jgi:hypothetical protein
MLLAAMATSVLSLYQRNASDESDESGCEYSSRGMQLVAADEEESSWQRCCQDNHP